MRLVRWLSPLLLAAAGCSLLLETGSRQCHQDRDCARFANAVCDTTTSLCVPAQLPGSQPDGGSGGTGGGGGGGAGDAGDGAATCPGPEVVGFANACTSARCVPFDNRARLLNLDEDGGLRPLPALP